MIFIYLVSIYKTGNTVSIKIIRHQLKCKTSEATTEFHRALETGHSNTEVSSAIRTSDHLQDKARTL